LLALPTEFLQPVFHAYFVGPLHLSFGRNAASSEIAESSAESSEIAEFSAELRKRSFQQSAGAEKFSKDKRLIYFEQVFIDSESSNL
jgi:hypothetical protein